MILTNDWLNVTIKGITFRSSKVPGFSQQWVLDATALAGWNDGVTTRRPSTQRALGDGDFADPATMSSRVVTITGVAVAETPQELHAMRDQFIGLLSDGQYTQLKVENSSGVRYATVGQEATPQWTQLTDTFASFKLDMFQPDPRIYGEQKTISIYGDATDAGGLLYSLVPSSTGASAASGIPSYTPAPVGVMDYSEHAIAQDTWDQTYPGYPLGEYVFTVNDTSLEPGFDSTRYSSAAVFNPANNDPYFLLMVAPNKNIDHLNYPLDYKTPVSRQWLSLYNAGNANAWPVFTIAGDFAGGFTITDNMGNNITYSGNASRFSPVTIDSGTGMATQGGQDRTSLLTSRQWFPVAPGQSIMPTFKPVNSDFGWCDIIYRDTWI